MNQKNSAKKPFRFNIIDALFLLVIIAASAALVYILFFRGAGVARPSAGTDIEYKVELRRVREELKGKINVGDKVIDASKLYTIGEVTDVRYKTSVYTGVNKADGVLVYSDYVGLINITVTIKANANTSTGYYLIDNAFKISVGTYVNIRVPNYTGSGFCTLIKEVTA